MFTDKTQFASAFTALVTPDEELIVIESPRSTRELEIPGGGVDNEDPSVKAAADRELIEETGISASGSVVCGQAELASRKGSSKTGLIVVALSYTELDAIDFGFTSSESTRVLKIPLEQFVNLDTIDEDPLASSTTFKGHRVMAAVALGIFNGHLPTEVEDYLSGPFTSDFLNQSQGHRYGAPATL